MLHEEISNFPEKKDLSHCFPLTNLSRLSIELGVKSQKLYYVDQGPGQSKSDKFINILCPVPATLALRSSNTNQIMPWTQSSHNISLAWNVRLSSHHPFLWFLLEYFFLTNLSLDLPSLTYNPHGKQIILSYTSVIFHNTFLKLELYICVIICLIFISSTSK